MKTLLWLLAIGLSLAFPLPMLFVWVLVWIVRGLVRPAQGPAPTGAAMRGVAPAIASPPVFSSLEHRFRLISGGRG